MGTGWAERRAAGEGRQDWESAERLMGALLMEQDEAWSTGRVYFDMRAYLEWKQEQPVSAVGDVAAE